MGDGVFLSGSLFCEFFVVLSHRFAVSAPRSVKLNENNRMFSDKGGEVGVIEVVELGLGQREEREEEYGLGKHVAS